MSRKRGYINMMMVVILMHMVRMMMVMKHESCAVTMATVMNKAQQEKYEGGEENEDQVKSAKENIDRRK